MNFRNTLFCLLAFFFIVFLNFSSAQIGIQKDEPCNAKSVRIKKNPKYAEWECGKLAEAVDCNEKLDYDDRTNTFTAGIDNIPFNGICETCHNNGLLEHRITFVNGKETGRDTTTYESGCPMVYREHVDGLRQGQWMFFYDTIGSPVQWENNYFMGNKHGKQVFFTQKGDTMLLENYKNGKMDGVKKTYYTKNRVDKEVYYTQGIFNGPFRAYNTKGKLLQELNYVMGQKDGEWKYFYDDGVPLKVEHWKLDVKDGEFKTFFYEGNPQTLENYKKGKKEGWFEEYYPNQKPKSKAFYKKDILLEEHKFDEKGREVSTFVEEKRAKKQKKEDDSAPGAKKKKKKKD